MKLAFCLFNYFPYGGLQRDFLRIARACFAQGHEIHVLTMAWEGEREANFHLHQLPVTAKQNHTRILAFSDQVAKTSHSERFDLVIGFNKMPHLDIYYAADVCFQERLRHKRSPLHRLLPRNRTLIYLERSVFAAQKLTQILLIAPQQQAIFIKHYQTEAERFHLLPPGIAKDRVASAQAKTTRTRVRESFEILPEDYLLLMVGSGFKTKGLDRILQAYAALPIALQQRSQLFIIGQDTPDTFIKLAKQLQIHPYIHFLGGRDDVPELLLAADLLIHPAYHENTGTVLLEAMVAGLPVLTTENCGYAHYVSEAEAGIVLEMPFQQAELNATLQKMLLSPDRKRWQLHGLAFAQRADIYSLPEKAAQLIEHFGRERAALSM